MPVSAGPYFDAVLSHRKLKAGIPSLNLLEGGAVWGKLASSILDVFSFSFSAASKMALGVAASARDKAK